MASVRGASWVRGLIAVGVLAVLGGGVAAWWWWPSSPPIVTKARDEDDSGEPIAVTNPGYVGPQTCAACHAARLAAFKETRHFRACWPAEAGPMPPGFTPQTGRYTSRLSAARMEMSRDGGDYVQTVIRDTPGREQRFPLRIAFVYGSGGVADEVYFAWKDDRLYELPLMWLHPDRRWGEQRPNPHGPPDLARPMTTRCLECHNTWVAHVPGSENRYRRDHLILGVTCENCHGPARDHVEYHEKHPQEKTARAIVHPGQLSRERLMDVCAQCHSNAMTARGPAFSYRPGRPLDEHFRTLVATGLENDHVADQTRYLRQSKCFQKSDMTCISCHDPHRATDLDKVRAACLQCHQAKDCREQPRLPAAVRSDCTGCHMPAYNRVAVNFHTEDDRYVFPVRPHQHRIAVYPAARDEVLLAWHRAQGEEASKEKAAALAKGLGAHWLAEAERLRQSHSYLAALGAVREAVRLHPSAETQAALKEAIATQAQLDADLHRGMHLAGERRFNEAIEPLTRLLKTKPDHARAQGRLGTLYAALNQRDRAEEHLRAAVKYGPDDAYGHNMLGWLAYLGGKAAEAVEHFRQADAIQPYTAEINHRWGLALMRLGRGKEAAERFRLVLKIDPNNAGGHQGLSHALRQLGQADEAVRHARRAVRLTKQQNADVLLSLADAYAAAGRHADGVEAAEQALTAAQANSPALVGRVRQRLEELRFGGGR